MPSKKKKSKAQKRFEKNKRTLDFEYSNELPARDRADFHKLTQDFLAEMQKNSNAVGKAASVKEYYNCIEVCGLAWNLSDAGRSYEQAMKKIKELPLKEANISIRMAKKFMFVRALRMLFSIPDDGENEVKAATGILTEEELDCFFDNMDLVGVDSNELPFYCNKEFHEFSRKVLKHLKENSIAASKKEGKDELEKCEQICNLAWELSISGGTYEKSLEELKSWTLNDCSPSDLMAIKYILIQALHIRFSLPADEKSVIQAASEFFNPEELDCFSGFLAKWGKSGLCEDKT